MPGKIHIIKRTLPAGLAACALITLHGSISVADEFCVSCTHPFAMYRCAINNNGALTAPAGAQLPCIKTLARQGGHKSCSVRRNTQDECIGKLLVLAPDPAMQIPSDHPMQATPDPAVTADKNNSQPPPGANNDPQLENAQDAEKPKPAREPRTVVELADQTVKSSKKNLDNAGKAVVDAAKSTGGHIKDAGNYVGGAAKKTWDCITSLFFKCGS